MKQEDKGLVIRGLVLLALIGGLVTFVLVLLFWRTPEPPSLREPAPENDVAALIAPTLASYPAGVSWYALYQLSETMPSAPGWDVRYNAAIALARRGSAKTPWPLLREMLDEKHQLRNQRVRHDDGHVVYDEAAARAFMIGALKALTVWHEKQKAEPRPPVPAELRAIYAQVDKLAESPFVEVKGEAEKARRTFFR